MIIDINIKDVLFGRDKICFNHVGNARFRLVISNHAEEYEHAPCRRDKSCIVYNVFNIVKAYDGRFLKRDGTGWKEVSDTEATQKVGHALRDKKQHEMRLRLKALRYEELERRCSAINLIKIAKSIVTKENTAIKKPKKVKAPRKKPAEKVSVTASSSALMKLGEICSHEMEQLKPEEGQGSSGCENEMSSNIEPAEKLYKEDETCASSILAMMSHRSQEGRKSGSNVLRQSEGSTTQESGPLSFGISSDECVSFQQAQLPPGFVPDFPGCVSSSQKAVTEQGQQLGALKSSIHHDFRDEPMTEPSRAVTPPVLPGETQMQTGWTYYPLAIPNYALQGGGAWELKLVPVNGQTGSCGVAVNMNYLQQHKI